MFTFRRVNQASSFSSPSIAASITIFQGLLKRYTLKMKQNSYLASSQNLKDIYQNLLIQVLQQYSAIITSELQTRKLAARIKLLEKQKEQQQKLYQAGTISKAELLKISAQIATEKANLVKQKGETRKQIHQLITLLGLDPLKSYEIEILKPDSSITDYDISLGQLTKAAVNKSPKVMKSYYEFLSSKYSINTGKAALFPSLTLSGTIGSNYSSNGGTVEINPATGEFTKTRTSYKEQMQDNFFQGFALTLSIPVFRQMETRKNIQQAIIQSNIAELNYRKARLEVLQQAKSYYLDFVAAKANYEAIQEQAKANKENFEFAKVQFSSGKIDFYNFFKALTDYENAKFDLQIAEINLFITTEIIKTIIN